MSPGPRICTVDRDELRRWIPAGYSPFVHLAGLLVAALSGVAALLATQVTAARAVDLLAVPATVAVATFLEYAAHRWLMHVPRAWLPQAWDAHTGRHHHYYRSDAPTWDRFEDIWLILFSFVDVAALALILAGPLLLLRYAIAPALWALAVVTSIGYFLLYEARGCPASC